MIERIPMDRAQFYFLFVNANSLADLAIRQLGEEILSMPEPEDPTAGMTQEEIDELVRKNMEGMDMSALDGIDFDFFSDKPRPTDSLSIEPESMPQPMPMPIGDDFSMTRSDVGDAHGEESGPLDIGRYLDKAYSYEDMLRARIDDCFRRADIAAITASLATIPAALPPLTRRLSTEEMTALLAAYRADDAGLSDAVVAVRALDMSGAGGG